MHLLLLIYLGLASFPLTYCLEFFCPSTSHWFKRAKSACNIADQYYCLYDDNNRKYTEICQETPTFDSAGHKVVIVGGIQGVDCENDIYQPFKYWTNGSSTCLFKKTPCNAEGQVTYNNGTTKTNRKCRCDYSRGYDFIKKPKNSCYCEPSKEDCSCYQKQCSYGFFLTPDYSCVNLSNWSMKSTCSMIPDSTDRDKERLLMQISKRDDEKGIKKSNPMPSIILSIIIGLVMIMIFFTALLTILIGMGIIFQSHNHIPPDIIGMGMICQPQNQIPPDIIELQNEKKEEWKTYFFNDVGKTAAYLEILDSIRKEQFVIVSGPAGCGKTFSTFHAALELEEKGKFDVWIISDPGDILKYSSTNRKQIYLIDDAFGKYSVNEYNTEWWSRQRCSVKDTLKENSNLKIVMTCRSYIYRSVTSMATIEPFCHLNLLLDHLKLTLKERRDIGEKCIKNKIIDGINTEVIMLYNFFPSLCSKFQEAKIDDMIEYFTFPVNYIEEEVMQLQTADDPLYLALAFLVIRGNKVKKRLLNLDNTKCDSVLEFLSRRSSYTGRSQKKELLSCFCALKDLYVLENESSFESLHEKLFILFAHCVGPNILKIILDHGKSSLLKERVRLMSIGENISKYDILVPKELKYRYFRRLMTDLENGKSYIVFTSSQHTSSQFRNLFIDYLLTNLKGRLGGDKHQIAMDVVRAMGFMDYLGVLNGLE